MSGKIKSIIIVFILLPILICDTVEYFSFPSKNGKYETVEITIPKGASLSVIADTLYQYRLIKNNDKFRYWAVLLNQERNIKAGKFAIPKNLTYAQLVRFLGKVKPLQVSVTLIEGWSNAQIIGELTLKLNLDKKKLLQLVEDEAFLLHNHISANNALGYLLPDTYRFGWGINEAEVLTYLIRRTQSIFTIDSIQETLKMKKLSENQILTLASIIEGEAMLDAERKTIASVYHNRLKIGMPLQADPTIQFIIKDGPRRLLYKDLKIDSPYNTYLHKGLPPGPINNPGKSSILAALYPAKTKYLYFVAVGDGSHTFTTNSIAHSKAKKAFNKVRKRESRNLKLNQKDSK
jgi:UPF0755 protein